MSAGAPRSTCSHCGSLQALAQRVPVSPSTAADAEVPAPSLLDAVAGLPWDSRVAACAGDGPASSPSTSRATSAGTARRSDGRSTMTPVRQGTEIGERSPARPMERHRPPRCQDSAGNRTIAVSWRIRVLLDTAAARCACCGRALSHSLAPHRGGPLATKAALLACTAATVLAGAFLTAATWSPAGADDLVTHHE